MPVAQSQGHAGKALAIAAVAIVLIAVVAVFVAWAASRGDVDINLGDERFNAGDVERRRTRSKRVVVCRCSTRTSWGTTATCSCSTWATTLEEGWIAFGAFDPDDPSCVVLIDREAETLVNECDESVTYPLDGEGLRQYPVAVEDGEILVDVNELTTSTTAG